MRERDFFCEGYYKNETEREHGKTLIVVCTRGSDCGSEPMRGRETDRQRQRDSDSVCVNL